MAFLKQLDQVKDQFQDLSTTLEEVCENLKGSDSPPPSEIMEEIINSANKVFEELKSCVIEWAKSVQMPDISDAQELDSIKAIMTFSKNIVAHQNNVQQDEKILGDINRALSIEHAEEGESFESLEQFRRDLNNLKSRVSTSPVSDEGQKDRIQILENKHLINDLFTLLECEDTLDDKRHGQIYEIISEKYGRTFASAATRGNLIFTKIIDTEGPQPLPPDAKEKPEESGHEGTEQVDGQAEVQPEEIPEEPPTATIKKEPDKSGSESADDLSVDGQAPIEIERKKEKTEPKELSDKNDITDQKVATQDDGLSSETHTDSSEESDASDVEGIQLTDTEKIEAEIAVALERGRFGIAYHLARTTPGVLPSFHAVKFIASNYVTDKDSPVNSNLLSDLAYKMRDEVLEILNEKPDSVQHSYAALMTSAALTPALTTHSEPIALLLESLDPYLASMPSLRTLAQTVVKASRSRINIPVEQLHGGSSFEKWIQDARDLQKEGKDWINAERQSSIRFAPATRVWHQILEVWEKGNQYSIGHMFELLSESVENIDIETITSVAAYWRQNGEREIANIDQKFRPAQSVVKPISGDAHKDLLDKIAKALRFVDQWDKLMKARPNEAQGYDITVLNNLRDVVDEHGKKALLEVGNIDTHLARRAENLVQQYLDKFKKTDSQALDSRLRLRDILNGDLLAEPSVMLDDLGHPKKSVTPELLRRLAKQDEPNFQTSILKRAKKGDFQGAYETLDFVERSGCLGEDDIDSIRIRVDEERSHVEQNLNDKVSEISNRLDIAYARGILTEQETDELRSFILQTDFSKVEDFKEHLANQEFVNGEINEANKKQRDKMKQRLELLENVPQEAVKRIEEAIQDNRFEVAEDYIERIENNDMLPDPDAEAKEHPFDHFFPEFVKKYDDFRHEKSDVIALIKTAIKNRKCAGPVDATHLSPATSDDGVNLIDAWSELYTSRTPESLKAFMSELGFDVQTVNADERQTSTEEKVFTLAVTPIANRRITQLPDFGSQADGRYRLVVIHSRTTVAAIVHEAGEWNADESLPNIVLFLNVLDVESRRELAQEFCRNKLRSTIVLDEALVTFLAMKPLDYDQRLSTFFNCASAFTFAQPFDPDASKVPPEMFFGRKRERDKIVAMTGDMTHFVYGGRRLGKTALLIDISREYESRDSDQLVLFHNLKPSEIGKKETADVLWREFAEKLEQHKIVNSHTLRFQTIANRVKQWLNEKDGHRILFLVDEADAFLAADLELQQGQRYRVLEQLKSLMEDTNRRFKVVFAGLNNVQQAARYPNTPFAHLGEPVRIGPMLPETDPNEIKYLIRDPLEALGYRFASDDSLIHIAAGTNYYPALAQQFCKDLLNRLRDRLRAQNVPWSSDQGPPYEIRPEVIDEVFDSKETRDRIRDLFKWTIQLDSRYEFLTYLIARQSFGNNDTRLNSVPIEDIRESALREWPQGFESDPTYETFEVLLDEMVGLGILREVLSENSKKFTIRTRNLRMLLGNNDEIERRFSDAKTLTPPSKPQTSQIRTSFGNGRLSSLTGSHEERLFSRKPGVGLIFGTRLAGLDHVQESLKEVKTQELSLKLYDTDADLASLDSQLREVAQRRAPGFHIVFVDARCVGKTDLTVLIEKALTFVSELSPSSNRVIRPVFLGGPSEAWMWMECQTPPSATGVAELWNIWLGPCAKGFAHAWLKDKEASAYADLERFGPPVYSPWSIVVEEAAGKSSPATMANATNLALDNPEIVSDVPS